MSYCCERNGVAYPGMKRTYEMKVTWFRSLSFPSPITISSATRHLLQAALVMKKSFLEAVPSCAFHEA
jgi:hypothetical protein